MALRIHKTLKLEHVSLKFDGTSGKFSGYASVFDGDDTYGDTILRGAFLETLKQNGMPKMFFNHEWRMPIGKYPTAQEDGKGLWLEGELTPGLALSEDVRAAMLHGTLDGLSVGGWIAKGDYESKSDGGRVIRKWSNLVEVSPVVFPADSAARIDLASVKSADFEERLPDCKTERDIERLLRDAGLGKWEAMALVSRAKELFSGRDAGEDTNVKMQADILARLQRLGQQ